MLMAFEVENFLSFKNRARYQGIGTPEKQHGDRVGRSDRFKFKTLPVGVMYGGNASLKSNFIKALDYAQEIVTVPRTVDQSLPYRPFRLADDTLKKPSTFIFTLLLKEGEKDVCYEYGFTYDSNRFHREWLTEVLATSEKVVFNRATNDIGKSSFTWGAWKDRLGAKDRSVLEFVALGTGKERAFLTESVTRNIDYFSKIYHWIRDNLIILYPHSKPEFLETFIHDSEGLKDFSRRLLWSLDTGINKLSDVEVPVESVGMPKHVREDINSKINDGDQLALTGPQQNHYNLKNEGGEMKAFKLVAFHKKEEGELIPFEIKHESQGSQRLIELIPAFHDLCTRNDITVVIDELDRSLHSAVTHALLEMFLNHCSPSARKQLWVTTHDQMLMNQKIFRRDEIWFVDRDSCGVSTMRSLSDFKKERSDKDIRKAYQLERFGGVPRIRYAW